MRFTTEMAELRRKVNVVRHGMGDSKTDLPTMMIRFEVGQDKATLFAAGKEMFAQVELKIKPDEGHVNGSFAILGSKLEKLIAQTEAEQVSFIVDPDNVEIHVGFLTVNFETYDSSVLLTVKKGVSEQIGLEGLATDRTILVEALSCAKSCSTAQSIRPDVTHAELRKGRLFSSDGRKIMIYTYDGFDKTIALKVPAGLLNDVTSALKNVESTSVQVIDGAAYYLLKANKQEYVLGIRKVERNFPDVEPMIKNAGATDEIAIDKAVFETILKGVALGLSSDEVKVSVEISGNKQDAFLTASALNAAGRRSHSRASCGRKQETPLQFPVSYKHLLDTFSVFKGDSVVDLFVITSRNLVMIKDKTEAREVLTVIPFRTEKAVEDERKEAEAIAQERKKAGKEDAASPTTDEAGGEMAGVALESSATDIDL